MEFIDKFANFKKYCPICKHYEKEGFEDPCNDCLDYPVNQHTTKPVKYEADEKRIKKLEKEQAKKEAEK